MAGFRNWESGIGNRDSGFRIQDSGGRERRTVHRSPATGHRSPITGHRPLVTGHTTCGRLLPRLDSEIRPGADHDQQQQPPGKQMDKQNHVAQPEPLIRHLAA